jgi:general secretion pathway protein L
MGASFSNSVQDLWEWWTEVIWPPNARADASEAGVGFPQQPIVSSAQAGVASVALWNHGAVIQCQHLKLTHATKVLPYSRSVDVARAFVSTKTPFQAEHVHIMVARPRKDHQASSCYVIKKAAVQSDLDALAAKKVSVDRVGIQDGDEVRWLPRRAYEGIHPLFLRNQRRRMLFGAALTALLVATAVTYARVHLIFDAAERQLASAMEPMREEAQKARGILEQQRKRLEAVEAARDGKRQSLPVTRVWEELTRVLPEDAWLTDLSIEGRVVIMTGFVQQSAASLIATLEASPLFSEPNFVSPVIRIPGQPGERFEIRLELQST